MLPRCGVFLAAACVLALVVTADAAPVQSCPGHSEAPHCAEDQTVGCFGVVSRDGDLLWGSDLSPVCVCKENYVCPENDPDEEAPPRCVSTCRVCGQHPLAAGSTEGCARAPDPPPGQRRFRLFLDSGSSIDSGRDDDTTTDNPVYVYAKLGATKITSTSSSLADTGAIELKDWVDLGWVSKGRGVVSITVKEQLGESPLPDGADHSLGSGSFQIESFWGVDDWLTVQLIPRGSITLRIQFVECDKEGTCDSAAADQTLTYVLSSVGGVLLVFMIVACVLVYRRRKQRQGAGFSNVGDRDDDDIGMMDMGNSSNLFGDSNNPVFGRAGRYEPPDAQL